MNDNSKHVNKTTKLPEENIRENTCNLGMLKDFLGGTQKP